MAQDDIHKDIELFMGLPEEDRELLTKHATTRTFKKNTILMTAGDQADSLYVILSGHVRIYLDDPQGREITLRTLSPGAAFGELAMLSEGARAANVATLEKCQLSVISKDGFMKCLDQNPRIALTIIQLLIQRIREMTDDISTLALLDVYGRVAKVLTREATECDGKLMTQPLTQQAIANMVGSSREMVSRILKDLRTGGYISLAEKRIILEKPLPAGW